MCEIRKPTNLRFIDLTGRRFGRLTVVAYQGSRKTNHLWECLCDCGKTKTIQGTNLGRGSTSCGCLQKEITAANNFVHGLRNSPEYKSWCNMKDRCSNPKNEFFHCYGGRGVAVCPEWIDSFEAFYQDMGPRPGLKYSIDRIQVDGNYELGNCRWATPIEQASNTRKNRFILVGGKPVTVSEASRMTGIKLSTLWDRLRSGASDSEAIQVRS